MLHVDVCEIELNGDAKHVDCRLIFKGSQRESPKMEIREWALKGGQAGAAGRAIRREAHGDESIFNFKTFHESMRHLSRNEKGCTWKDFATCIQTIRTNLHCEWNTCEPDWECSE